MADINVTLGADISDYSNKLKAAEQQALGFGSKVTTSFGSLQTGVDKINGKFQLLTHTLVGVGIIEFIHSLLEGANNLKDLSDGLGLSVARFMEMRLAATASGSSMEGMAKMLAKMEQAIGAAVDGNYQFQESLAKVGISTKEYFSLSPDQQFLKIAEGLTKIENPAERTRLKLELLGKGAYSLDPGSYVKKINELYGSMEKYAESQRTAADTSESLKIKTELVNTAFLKLIEPIVGIGTNTKSMNEQLGVATGLAKLLATGLAAFAASTIVNAVQNIATSFKTAAAWMGLSKIETDASTRSMLLNANAASYMEGAHARLGRFTATVADLEFRLAEARALSTSSAANIAKLEAQLAAARQRLAAATEAVVITEKQLNAEIAAGTAVTLGATVATERAAVATGAWATALGVVRGILGFIASVASTVISVILALSILNDFTKNAENKGWFDQMAEGLEKLTRWASPGLADALERIGASLGMKPGTTAPDDVKKKWEEAQKKAKEALEAGKGDGKTKDPLGDQVKERIRLINEETETYNKMAQVAELRTQLEAGLTNMTSEQKDIILATYDARVKYLNEIDKIEKQIAQARIEQAGKSTDKEKGKIGEVIKALEEQKDKIKDLSEETRKFKEQQYEVSRQFSTGWNKAFSDYIDSATNAATVAENLFKKAMSGMEDAIVNFAKTGKFQWKNFVAMMAEELLRSQVRQLMANIMLGMKAMSGGGSILGSIGSLLGFKASGGPVAGGNPYIVGERGPELFVPPSNGNIVPNNQIAGGAPVTLNINAVDAPSFQALVASNPQFIYAVAEMGRRSVPGMA